MAGLILVPLDGSATAEHAIHYARRIARLSGAELRLVHVHAPPPRHALSRVLPGSGRAVVQTRKEKLRRADAAYLHRLADRVGAGPSLVRVSWDVLDGPVEATLLRYVGRIGADLVVMTTRGRGGLARVRIGSVANRLARQAAAPVILVPPAGHPPDAYRERGFGRILIALDGSRFAEEIVAPARVIGSLVNAEFTLLRAVRPADGRTAHQDDGSPLAHRDTSERRGAAVYLNRIAGRIRRQGSGAEVGVVEHPDPAEAILAHATKTGASLIALTTVGRGGIARMVLGSVADRVMREADVPVLVLNPNVPSVRPRLGIMPAPSRRTHGGRQTRYRRSQPSS